MFTWNVHTNFASFPLGYGFVCLFSLHTTPTITNVVASDTFQLEQVIIVSFVLTLSCKVLFAENAIDSVQKGTFCLRIMISMGRNVIEMLLELVYSKSLAIIPWASCKYCVGFSTRKKSFAINENSDVNFRFDFEHFKWFVAFEDGPIENGIRM